MRYNLIIIVMLFLIIPQDAQAQKSWWDVLFPTGRNIPAETLTAPFADPDAVILEPEVDSMLSLNTQHRQNLDIVRWTEIKVSDLLQFTAKNYEAEFREKAINFDEAGEAEYLKFLQEQNILKPLSTGSYDVKGFSLDIPVILNQGNLNGRYRWLLQIPVMVTFIKIGEKDYNKMAENEYMHVEYTVNMQVGRTQATSDELGIIIESWEATPVEKDTQ